MVYRPPKHKPAGGGFGSSRAAANSPSSDPFGTPPGHLEDPEAGLPGDDRNLVAVDESYSGGDIEDRLWLFWQRQSKNVMRALIAVCVGLILWQSWKMYQQHAQNKLEAEYQAANGAAGLAAFSQARPDTTLGKLAMLEAADSYYKDGKFKDAADAYGKAAVIWGIDEKGQRARLGQGLSLAQSGDTAGGEQHLQNLYEDSAALPSYRAEAAFYNAVLFAQNGDNTGAAMWIDHVNAFKDNKTCTLWISEATTLADAIPALKGVTPSPGGTSATPAITIPSDANATPAPAKPEAAVTVTAAPPPAAPAMPIAPVAPKPPAATAAPAASSAPAAPASTSMFDMSKLNGATSGGTSSK